MNKKLQNKLEEICPTFYEYYEAKQLIERSKKLIKQYESNLKTNNELLNKKFYVQMGFNYYSVGTFGGWDKNGDFMLKIEDVEPYSHIKDSHYVSTPIENVFEKKQKGMLHLESGIE